jgi:hypothetical protein
LAPVVSDLFIVAIFGIGRSTNTCLLLGAFRIVRFDRQIRFRCPAIPVDELMVINSIKMT